MPCFLKGLFVDVISKSSSIYMFKLQRMNELCMVFCFKIDYFHMSVNGNYASYDYWTKKTVTCIVVNHAFTIFKLRVAWIYNNSPFYSNSCIQGGCRLNVTGEPDSA